jgi:hypothetical protein
MLNSQRSASFLLAAILVAAISACSKPVEQVNTVTSAPPANAPPASMAVPIMSASAVKLTGDEEVPPVKTSGSGTSSIQITADGSVSGSISTTGLAGTAAHIHMAAKGANGPVIVPLTKSGDSSWSVPVDAKLSADQLTAYRNNGLYVNVHTDANKDGEIRGQLVP